MSESKQKTNQKFQKDNGIEKQELLKRANLYYQNGNIEAAVIFFNEVLKLEPENSTALFFIKLKKEQYVKEKSLSESAQTKLNCYIIESDYENAYRVLTSLLQENQQNQAYIELHNILHNLIETKLKQKLIEKVGNLSARYIVSGSSTELSEEEKQVYCQFKLPNSLMNVLESSTLNHIRVLNIFHKMIKNNQILTYKNLSSETAINESIEMMGIMDDIETPRERQAIDPVVNKKNNIEIDALNYEELYKKAMGLYVRRKYQESLELFTSCIQLNPDDTRAHHNVNKLKERLS